MLFDTGIFRPDVLNDERTANILLAATDSASLIRPGDILRAAITASDAKILAALSAGLAEGAQVSHVREIIDVYRPRDASSTFTGDRTLFSAESLAALDEFGRAFAADQVRLGPVCLELLMVSVLRHLDEEDRTYLTVLDPDAAITALRAALDADPPAPLFDTASGRLRSEEFTEYSWAVLERSAVQAAELGYDRILVPHCLLALLGETEGLAERLVRLQAKATSNPAKITAAIADGFRLGGRRPGTLKLHRGDIGEGLVGMLRTAQRSARTWGAQRVDTPHLLAAVLEDPPGRLVSILQSDPVNLSLAKLREHLHNAMRDQRGSSPHEVAFRLPAGLLPAEDLTWLARTEGIPPAPHLDGYFDALSRALHRRTNNHVLITGQRGVGTTTLITELARRAADGEIPFLARKRFVRVDCRAVAPEESGAKLASLIGHLDGRTDVVICVDGLGALLRGPSDTNHKLVLLGALREARIQLVGVLETGDYEDLLSGDHALLECVTRVEVIEPSREAALDMATRIAGRLSGEFGVAIEDRAVERAVLLSSDYIMYERLPAKAAKILQLACEDLDYERSQQGSERGTVGVDDVIAVVSRLSGLPVRQLSGVGTGAIDYQEALADEVVGQEAAVAAVASELRLIKAGLRPGSVLFFAGLTGVGKTELAKAIARFYSASKRLQTYTMGNFTEGHTVSGITGVAPGYRGYERGGRLINDLNSDPYCVFLLDEAEKAHPDIWKPFLTLFDEGWVEDQRGVRAFGDRAIFILTSNAGAEVIARTATAGASMDSIVRAVREHLPTVAHQKTGERVFPPEFLARIRKIIVFKPLDQAAMVGICRKMLGRRERFWAEKREKQLVVPDALVAHIARLSHQENMASGGKEGGRIVDKKIAELVEETIAREVERQPDAYSTCRRIELSFDPVPPAVTVAFLGGDGAT
ncbi:MAG TPA: AAA family ATPase [Pseudonocardiaceae bacterium]|nr:AAA family ATPase [Pseudonocardiaceae bacterium]